MGAQLGGCVNRCAIKAALKLLIGLAFVWLLIFVFIPNGMVLLASFLTKNTDKIVQMPFTLSNYLVLFDHRYGTILWNSVFLAGLSSLICLLIGYPTAWLMTRLTKRQQAIFLFLLILPFWTNSLIRTYAIKILLGNHGLINDALIAVGLVEKPLRILYTQTAVIFGFVYILLPFMVLPIYNAIDKLPLTFRSRTRLRPAVGKPSIKLCCPSPPQALLLVF